MRKIIIVMTRSMQCYSADSFKFLLTHIAVLKRENIFNKLFKLNIQRNNQY